MSPTRAAADDDAALADDYARNWLTDGFLLLDGATNAASAAGWPPPPDAHDAPMPDIDLPLTTIATEQVDSRVPCPYDLPYRGGLTRAATASARLEFRVRPERKSRIEEAAAVAHLPVSEFVRSAVEDRAEEVLREHEVTTRVPAEYFDDLLAALDAPPQPSTALARAAERARDLVTHD